MEERFVRFKPRLPCLVLHRVGWVDEDSREDIHYCMICKDYFYYPTKKEHNPVYKKFL